MAGGDRGMIRDHRRGLGWGWELPTLFNLHPADAGKSLSIKEANLVMLRNDFVELHNR